MKNKFFVFASFLFLAAQTYASGDECSNVFNTIAKDYLQKNGDYLEYFIRQSGLKEFDFNSLKFVKAIDQNQGSFDLIREAYYLDKNKVSLVLITKGDFWCTNEQVLGIRELKQL